MVRENPDGCIDARISVGVSDILVPIRIARVVPSDLPADECLRVTAAAGAVACIAADVARGRLPGSTLYRFMDVTSISKLVTMGKIITDEHDHRRAEGLPDTIPGHALGIRTAPAITRRIRTMVTSPTAMDIVVCVSIGSQLCWAAMGWKLRGTRWMCTSCDIG